MAKRKSTDETSKPETEDQVKTDGVTDPKDPSEDPKSDSDTTDSGLGADGAGDDTPKDDADSVTASVTDDVIEQEEPKPEDAPTSEDEPTPDVIESTETTDVDDGKTLDDHLSEEEAEALIIDAETVEGHNTEREPEPEPAPEATTYSEPVPIAPQVIRETTVERKGGFVPMLLGGVVAAGLGYGVAAYVSQDLWPFATADDSSFEDDIRAALTAQDGSLSELGTRLADLEGAEVPTVDLTPIEEQLATVQSATSDLSTRLDEITARIDTLERQPLEQAVSPEAIAAYERALADLQADVEAQRAEIVQMAQEAVAAEENAEGQAQLAASRAALAEITTGLESGAPFSGAVGVLSSNGVAVPDVLSENAESGVPTQTGLMEDFPGAARDALSAARTMETDGAQGAGRIASFFANQLGARSVAPREGNDPDAVLSRAEAALRSGDLETTLSELSALPEVAQDALSDWQSRAQTRLEAKTAADGLVQQLLQE